MSTFQSDKGASGVQPRGVHAGTNTVRAEFMWGVTDSSSSTAAAADVLNMVKLPHQATVTSVVVYGNRDDGSYKFGTSASASLFGALVSVSAGITTCSIGVPTKISLSDDASVAYEWLNATVVSSGYTLSDYVGVIVQYVIDN